MDWFRDNTLFYDNSSIDYKNLMKRERLVREIGVKLRLTETSVLHWLCTMRTQFGKVKNQREKSGHSSTAADFQVLCLLGFTLECSIDKPDDWHGKFAFNLHLHSTFYNFFMHLFSLY